MPVPYTFGTATAAIPLSQLDSNFSTAVTIGNTAVQLGNTVTTLNNITLANVTVSSGNSTVTKETVTTITSPTATNLTLQSAGTTAVTIDTSQNVGIGTSSPSARLSINGGSLPTASSAYSLSLSSALAATRLTSDASSRTSFIGSYYDDTAIEISQGVSSGYVSGIVIGSRNSTNATVSDAVAIYTRSTERMRLDSSGNLGLGVTPSAWDATFKTVQVNYANYAGNTTSANITHNAYYNAGWKYIASSTSSTIYDQFQGAHRWFNAPSGTAGNAISFTQAMTLDNSGNLLVGATSRFNGFTATNKLYVESSTGDFVCHFRNTNASPFGLGLSYSTAPNVASNSFLYATDSSSLRFTVYSNGGIANFSGNNSNLSDRREKTNFAPAKPYLDVICAIPVQTFNYVDQNMEEDFGLTLGVVAQDVEAVAPELVMESNWGTKEEPKMRLSIYQTDLQYALMKCIQEQQALIQSLTTRLTALENK